MRAIPGSGCGSGTGSEHVFQFLFNALYTFQTERSSSFHLKLLAQDVSNRVSTHLLEPYLQTFLANGNLLSFSSLSVYDTPLSHGKDGEL